MELVEQQSQTLGRMEFQMNNLDQSVANLQAAVDAINVRFAGQVASLTAALADANQALADEALDDASREAALAEALASADAAAAAINEQIVELNAIGANPEEPVVPEEPAPPSDAHPDQTLPGDLPPNPDDPHVEHR